MVIQIQIWKVDIVRYW